MPVPPYQDLITPSSTANGLISETVDDRILSLLAMLASGKAPDGSTVSAGGGGGGGASVYGDGFDGSPTFDGSTVVLGMTPVSSVYTLTRDLALASPTINNGVTVVTNGYRIFVSGTLNNNGTIAWNGTSSASQTGGAGFNNTSCPMVNPQSYGGANAGTGSGSNGTASANYTYGGQGGSGGASGANTGGSGGSVASGVTNIGLNIRQVGTILVAGLPASSIFSSSTTGLRGGTGGGAGAGDNTNNGGGGGGGGGIVLIAAKVISGVGNIQSRGGNGFSPTLGNTGGGGGGGGGVVLVASTSVIAGVITGQTVDANGGTGGTAHGTGNNGSNGNNGLVCLLPG